MISFSQGARIVVATKPVDFRRGGESLASLAREVLKEDPYKGVIVIFRSRRADRIKVVTWDQSVSGRFPAPNGGLRTGF
jgi:transposase